VADVAELPRITDAELSALEEFDDGDGRMPYLIGLALGELRALRQTVEIAQADADKARQDLTNAHGTIAMMHACAVGDRNGPRAGVVEDIVNLRQYAIQTRVALDNCVELTELQEQRIEVLTKARDTLGNIALNKSDPKDEVERARISALLKVGNLDAQETPTIVSG
jgi:hypothetical protein